MTDLMSLSYVHEAGGSRSNRGPALLHPCFLSASARQREGTETVRGVTPLQGVGAERAIDAGQVRPQASSRLRRHDDEVREKRMSRYSRIATVLRDGSCHGSGALTASTPEHAARRPRRRGKPRWKSRRRSRLPQAPDHVEAALRLVEDISKSARSHQKLGHDRRENGVRRSKAQRHRPFRHRRRQRQM